MRELRDANENAPDGQEAQALTAQIKQWIPDAVLTENRAVDFYVRYFFGVYERLSGAPALREGSQKIRGSNI